jgi:hypothetical protein
MRSFHWSGACWRWSSSINPQTSCSIKDHHPSKSGLQRSPASSYKVKFALLKPWSK